MGKGDVTSLEWRTKHQERYGLGPLLEAIDDDNSGSSVADDTCRKNYRTFVPVACDPYVCSLRPKPKAMRDKQR